MKLDFCRNGKIPLHYLSLYNWTADKISAQFNEVLDSLSNTCRNKFDWFLTGPASRNTLSSPFFQYCCSIAFLQELLRKGENISEIITDSKSFKLLLIKYLRKHGIKAKVRLKKKDFWERTNEIFRPAYLFFAVPLLQFLIFLFSRITKNLGKSIQDEELILIDTFVLPGYIESDRYYTGALDVLNESEKKNIYFVPLIYGFKPWKYYSVIKQIRQSRRNFLLKEDYLRLSDYFYAWGHIFRIREMQIKNCNFLGIDISELVKEEIWSFREFSTSFIALLNYCFAKRLKHSGIKLKLVIDWFENQIVDRGWNAGFRRFYPEVRSKGYQGYIATKFYLCMYPTEYEKNNKVIPEEVSVIGKGLVGSVRKYCPDLDVSVAPGFRFQNVWQKRNFFPEKDKHTILVSLPMMEVEAVYILRTLVKVSMELDESFRFWIKIHPATTKFKLLKAVGDNLPENFEVTNHNFNECVERSDVLISNSSSTCLEALSKGIPVVIIGNQSGIPNNPIPETVNQDVWKLCYTTDEIAKSIRYFKNRNADLKKEHNEIFSQIRDEYFEPVTRQNVINFFDLRLPTPIPN